MPDTQITELAGRHYLISQLLAGGVEVAIPVRDKGIDLIAYVDNTESDGGFVACPIQMKANQQQRFGVLRKYEKIQNLLFAYVWKVSVNPEVYAMTYAEAVILLESKGHTNTRSWQELGGYSLSVNDDWRERLQPYRMDSNLWLDKIRRTANVMAQS